MINKQTNLKKLIWQVLASILLLIVLGNLIMFIVARGEKITGQMFLLGAINSVLIGGSFMLGLMFIVAMLDRKLPWLQNPLKRLIVQFFVTMVFSLIVIVLRSCCPVFSGTRKSLLTFFSKQGLSWLRSRSYLFF